MRSRLTPKKIKDAFDDELIDLVLDHAWGRFRDDLPAMICAGKGDRVATLLSTLPKGCWVVLLTTILEYKLVVSDAAKSAQIAAMALEAYRTLGAQAHVDYLKGLIEGRAPAAEQQINLNTEPHNLRIKYIRENPYEFVEEDL
jgi:hypothetical protein